MLFLIYSPLKHQCNYLFLHHTENNRWGFVPCSRNESMSIMKVMECQLCFDLVASMSADCTWLSFLSLPLHFYAFTTYSCCKMQKAPLQSRSSVCLFWAAVATLHNVQNDSFCGKWPTPTLHLKACSKVMKTQRYLFPADETLM